MSTNRITIQLILDVDGTEVEYSCQYLKHNEGINRLYYSTCHVEYDSKDSNIDISTLKNNLAQIQAHKSIKARIEVDYLDLHKTLYIQGSIYAFKVNSTAGSTLTTYVLYLSHETRPMSLSHYSGVSYQAQAKDMIERRLIKQSDALNLSDYTAFFEKVNYNSESRFPVHPMLVQWKQSTYAFMDRILGTHGLWYHLYSHKGGVDFVIGDHNEVFSGHSDEIKNDKAKSFYFDDEITVSLQDKQSPVAAYQYQRIYNGMPITDITLSPGSRQADKILFADAYTPLHYIDYQALKRKLSDKRSQQQNHQQLGAKLQRQAQQAHKQHSTLSTQQRTQRVSQSHSDYISHRKVEDAKKQLAQNQQALFSHQASQDNIQAEIEQLSKQLSAYEAFYEVQKTAPDKNHLQTASFRQFENISFYHSNQETPSQKMTELLPLAITSADKKVKPYITQDYSVQGDDYFPVINVDQFKIMAQTQQEQVIWNNAPRVISSFQGYVLRAGTMIKVALNRKDEFPEADIKHFQDYPEYLITDVLYEYTAERNQRGHAKVDALGRVTNYQEKHTVMGSFPKCDYRPLVNVKKLIGQADYMVGVKAYQISPASFEVVPNKQGYIPIQLPLDYHENVGSSCYYAPRLSSSNTGKMNQSHPIYPDSELSISFLNGNPETPIIRGAIANKATGHVNNQDQDKRMILTSPQGHMFSNTLNAGDDNSATLKTKHGFQSQKAGSHQSYFSLSNVGSTSEEGKKQLDITEATTANKTLKAGNKFEYYAGVTNNDITQPNYGLIIDPNVEEPKSSPVISKLVEVKDNIVSAAQAVAVPAVKKFQTAMQKRIDLSNACNEDLVLEIQSNRYKKPPTLAGWDDDSKFRSLKYVYYGTGQPDQLVTLELISDSREDSAQTININLLESNCAEIANCSLKSPQIVLNSEESDQLIEKLADGSKVSLPVPSLAEDGDKEISFIDFITDVVMSKPEPKTYKVTPKTCGQLASPTWMVVKSYPQTSWSGGFELGYKGSDDEKLKQAIKNDQSDDDGWYLSASLEVKRNQHSLKLEEKTANIFPGIQKFLSQILPFLTLSTRYVKLQPGLPKVSLSGNGELFEYNNKPTIGKNYNLKFEFDPLLSYTATIDILAMLCDVFGWSFLVELRDIAKKGINAEGKVGGKATVALDLIVSGGIKGTLEYNTNQKVNDNGASLSGEMSFHLQGEASGEVKVFVVKAKAGVIFGAKSAFGVKLVPSLSGDNKPQVDGQLYFDGLIIYYMTYTSVEVSKSKNSNDVNTQGNKAKRGAKSLNYENKKESSQQYTVLEPKKWPDQPKLLSLDKFNGSK